jgi:uncharacterized protein YdeI (YjbR/CyaY-like superfamily)
MLPKVYAMSNLKTYRATNRAAWREWLAKNHGSERELWVVFPKAHTNQPCMSYEDSVEEALCYGWIDSIIKRIDDDTYARKFTPRTNHENWSRPNKRRVAKVIREGRMTAIGLAKITYPNPEIEPPKAAPKPKAPLELPSFMQRALKANAKAWANFNGMPPSHRKSYILWVTMAKREETREKRLREAIHMITNNKELGLK